MTQKEMIVYCLSKPGTFLDYPFGPETAVIKVKAEHSAARIFAQFFSLKGRPKVTFYCDRETGEFYRSVFPDAVTRGYHCPPVQQPYFNTVDLLSDLPDKELLEMIDHAYAAVVKKLPKKHRQELNDIKI